MASSTWVTKCICVYGCVWVCLYVCVSSCLSTSLLVTERKREPERTLVSFSAQGFPQRSVHWWCCSFHTLACSNSMDIRRFTPYHHKIRRFQKISLQQIPNDLNSWRWYNRRASPSDFRDLSWSWLRYLLSFPPPLIIWGELPHCSNYVMNHREYFAR